MDGNAEFFGSVGEQPADIPLCTEPQDTPVVETGSERLIDEPSAAKPRTKPSCFVQKGPGVEDLKDLGVWEPERVACCRRQRGTSLGELPGAGSVDALQEPPISARGKP